MLGIESTMAAAFDDLRAWTVLLLRRHLGESGFVLLIVQQGES